MMMGIGMKMRRRGGVRATLASLLAKYGSNAHAWLPGASGVSVSGLPTSNYLLSDGSTGYSSTDSVVGLVLDGMGSVGAELVTNGGFDTDTAWTKEPGWTISGGKANFSNPTATNIYQGVLTSTKTYKATIVISSVTSGNVAIRIGSSFSSYFTAAGTYEFIAVAGSFVAGISCANGPVPTVASIDSFSVREITGIHASQATTSNKCLLKKDAGNRFYWQFDATDLLTSTFPAGYEAATVINILSAGQVTTENVNMVGSYSIGPSVNSYGRIVFKTAPSAADLAAVQALANKLAGL